MSSKLELFNLALGRLRSKLATDTDPDVDTSRQVAACDREYYVLRDQLLTSRPWYFASRLQDLTVNGTAPPGRWIGRYALPATSDDNEDPVLAVVEAYLASDPTTPGRIEWELWQSKAASTNAIWLYADTDENITVHCIEQVSAGVWPEAFASYFAWQLAAAVAMPLTGNRELAVACHQEGALALRTAIDVDRRARRQQTRRPIQTHPAYSARLARLGSSRPVMGETPD